MEKDTGAVETASLGADADVEERSNLELERYVNSVTGAIERLGAIEEKLARMGEEGWPTKMRGDPRSRLTELDALSADARAEATSVSPTQPRLAALHSHLLEATATYTRVVSAGLQAERFEGSHQVNALIEARDEALTKVGAWVEELRAIAIDQGGDVAPVVAALESTGRSVDERLKAFGLQLLAPFRPIVPLSAHRLFVAPFLPPYGPLSPPAMPNHAQGLLRRLPGYLGIVAALFTLTFGLAISLAYYSFLAGWWIAFGWWISLIASARARDH